MIEQNGSDPMFGKEKDENEQDSIELTDKTVPGSTTDDDDILELTSEVEEALGEADAEEVLELTSTVEESTGEADDEDILELSLEADDDDILELTSEVEEAAEESDGEEILELTSEVAETTEEADDEDILELTSEVDEITGDEFVEQTESELHDASWEPDEIIDEKAPEEIITQPEEAAPEAIPELSEDEEDLLDLLSDEPETAEEPQQEAVTEEEILETAPVEVSGLLEPADMNSETDLPEKDVELASVIGVELDPARDLSLEPHASGDDIEVEVDNYGENESGEMPTFIIPKNQLEAAIGRAIETKLSEKIDKLLTETIERAVTTEIDRLKRLLSDELSDK